MLIACPNCASSYMIDPAVLGAAGRSVRCTRCKATWHAGGPKTEPDVAAIADKVVAEAEGQTSIANRPEAPAAAAAPKPEPKQATKPALKPASAQKAADDFGPEALQPISTIESKEPVADPPTEEPAHAPADAQASEPEPATIADSPPLVPPIENEPLPEAGDAALDSEDTESFDARRRQILMRRKQSRRSSRWTAVILVLVAFNVALVGARNEVVRYMPQTASLFAAIGLPVNLRHLKFDNVRITKETQDGSDTLIVQGSIISEASRAVEVPRLRFAARNATGQEVYAWSMAPSRSILGPGERLEFRSQIPSPPADASDVMVRFFTAQDEAAGAK